jgi:UDP-N-acetylglucosamine--N-acetylmuramyl-(pentapeptide) pyrophosphoryl-undecaprenol N-acetylglucosamine transferase
MTTYRPEAILATGGYVCAPVVVAGWLRRVPSLVYLPDTEPGWAVRFLSPFARRVAVTVPESARFFSSRKTVCTGYPVRADVGTHTREAARAHFGIPSAGPVLLVTGGSRGALRLNQAVADSLETLLDALQVIHVCGQAHHASLASRAASLPEPVAARYHLFAYLHEMPMAMAAADLVVSRAGASVLGEYPAVGLPSVLVPLSQGHRDQERNAAYMAEHGAAVVIADAELSAERLNTMVRELLGDRSRVANMSAAARAMAQPFAARRLADELVRMTNHGDGD